MKSAEEYLESALDLMNRLYADPTIAEQSMRRAELLIKIAQVVSTERQAVALEKLANLFGNCISDKGQLFVSAETWKSTDF